MTDRRRFLVNVTTGAAALSAPAALAVPTTANSLVLGVIGPGGMGINHVKHLVQRNDVEIAWICDVDSERTARAAAVVKEASGRGPKVTADLRHVLDDVRVDAVFIATPDHWHAPAAIMALNAGKHVYVEKPCCHNIREGRLIADAVSASGKCLQVGTQSRSTEFIAEAMQRIREGEIGDVLVAKAWNSQRRGSIGKQQPANPPKNLDFDSWIGPAPLRPYQSNLLHGVWRWWHDFGCGDIGNDGVHDIDVALWGLGVDRHPNRATCIGSKCFFDDDQQFPDTQYAVFEYDGDSESAKPKQMIFEQRIWSPYRLQGYENGEAFYGTNGYIVMGHTQGWKMYGARDKLIAQREGRVDLNAHHSNFFDCVRGSSNKLNADIAVGHRSATLVHLANIAARTGTQLELDPEAETITNDTDSNELIHREYRDHWSVPEGV